MVEYGDEDSRRIQNFGMLAKYGSLKEKQALLGVIALKYHPDFFPCLQMALRDEEPTVRAQAAAVYARLQSRYRGLLHEITGRIRQEHGGMSGGDELPAHDEECLRILQECVESGFLDSMESKQARLLLAGMEAGRHGNVDGSFFGKC
jgi:hypothetical protein